MQNIVGLGGVIIGFNLEWVYFDVEAERQETHALRRHVATAMGWTAAHFPLMGAIVVSSSGLGLTVLSLVEAEGKNI